MTYEQSLQNIENIKNFVLPYGHQVAVFDFQSANSFRVVFYENYTDQINDPLMAAALTRGCAFAHIENDKNDQSILSYIDDHQILLFNLTTNETIDFYRKRLVDKEKLKKEFEALLRHLKNT